MAASYRKAIEAIAYNDEGAELDPEVVSGLASVLVVSIIFDKDQDEVANAVVKFRKKHLNS